MMNLQPWEKWVRRWIGGPAFVVTIAGLALLLWSVAAGVFNIPRLVPEMPDWALGLVMLSAGSLVGMAVTRLTSHRSGLLVSDHRVEVREQRQESPSAKDE